METFWLSCGYDADIYDAIDFASRNGFGYIVPDLMIPRFFPERFSQHERKRIKEVVASESMSISFHAPSDYLNLGSVYPEVRKAILHRMILCLDFARDVGAERFTIHIDPPYGFVFAGKKGTYIQDHWAVYKNAIKESLEELAEYSRDKVLLCVENDRLGEMAIEVLEELLHTEKIFLTWDVPKSNTDGKPIASIESFFMRHLERVRECHLHDEKPGKHSHDMIGVGKIDFSRYLRLLIPQDVDFTLEIRPRENALESLRILEKILETVGWKIQGKER